MTRLTPTFARLNQDNRAGFVAYVMAGDPDAGTTLETLRGLADAGADVIELGRALYRSHGGWPDDPARRNPGA